MRMSNASNAKPPAPVAINPSQRQTSVSIAVIAASRSAYAMTSALNDPRLRRRRGSRVPFSATEIELCQDREAMPRVARERSGIAASSILEESLG